MHVSWKVEVIRKEKNMLNQDMSTESITVQLMSREVE